MHAHMSGVLWAVEVLWVAGFLAVFVFYLILKRRIKKKKAAAEANAAVKKNPAE
jgi:beta-lactamase regulating signal transducer with metallopeptidase domain